MVNEEVVGLVEEEKIAMEKDDLKNQIISGYLDYAYTLAHDLEDSNFWAYEVMSGLVAGRPEIAWQIILEVIQKIDDQEELELIGASELEDLLCQHPHLFIERVEMLAQSDIKFKKVLSNVWGWSSIPEEILTRIGDACK